jgi:hypothetical protein
LLRTYNPKASFPTQSRWEQHLITLHHMEPQLFHCVTPMACSWQVTAEQQWEISSRNAISKKYFQQTRIP